LQPTKHSQADLLAQVDLLFEDSIVLKRKVQQTQAPIIIQMAEVIAEALRLGGKILLCGNGGSAADAQHIAAELLIRLRPHVNREGLAALALATDPSSLTACGNDYGFETYYERMVCTLGKPPDILIGITTSGNSPNIIRALQAAQKKQLKTLGLLGCDGGKALEACDLALVVPSKTTGRIQEVHITVGHILAELVEDLLQKSGHLTF